MALQKQTLALALSKGLDTKTDPKQVMAGKLTLLENGTFGTLNSIEKCPGNAVIPGSLAVGVNTAAYNDELVSLDGSNLWSYSSSTASQFNKGTLPTTEIETSSVSRNSFTQINGDSAISGNLKCFIWAQVAANLTTYTLHYSIIDSVTGQSIVNDIGVAGVAPVKVLSLGVYFIIIARSNTNGDLYYYAINTSTPTTLGTQQLIASDFDFNADATISGGKLFLAYNDLSFNLNIYSLSSSLVLSPKYVAVSGYSGPPMSIFGDASGNVWLAYQDIVGIKVTVINSALTAVILAPTAIVSIGIELNRITGIVTGTTATLFYELGLFFGPLEPRSTWNNIIYKATVTLAGVPTAPVRVVNGLALFSKAFVYNSVYYFVACFPTILQATYFVLNESGLAVAKISPGTGGAGQTGFLTEANMVSATSFQFASLIKDSLTAFGTVGIDRAGNPAAPNNLFSGTGIQSSQVTFTTEARPKWYLGQNLHFGGGILWMYDGAKPVEHSFNIYPEGVLAQNVATSGGGIGVGSSGSSTNQVQYSAIYEWTDNQGQLHKSATSIPLTVPLPTVTAITFTANTILNNKFITGVSSTVGLVVGQVITNTNFPAGTYIADLLGGGSTIFLSAPATASSAASSFSTKDVGANTIRIPTLRLTAKSNVAIVIYRTLNNQTIFYRLNDPKAPLMNDPTVNYIDYVDTQADAAIIGNEQLYTTGGEVDNISAPAISSLTSYRNRMIGLSPENPFSWFYSKQVIPGTPVEWNPQLFTQAVDPKGGFLKACAEMDDKLILFKQNLIFYVVGEGPTPSGLNNDFQNPQVISTDTGCDNPRSVVLSPVGVFFQSPKGIYLIGRNLSVSYIGADVEAYNSSRVTSALLITTLNQVRFTLDSGVILVYDYFVQQWSIFTERLAADATVFQNQYTYISPAGLILQENPDVFTNNGAFIKLKMKSAWLSFGGVQGYERLYKLLLLGDYKSPHTLRVSVAHDFIDAFNQVTDIPVLTDPGLYQYRVFTSQQKCEAIQFQIEDTQDAPFGEGFALSSMAFEIGIKQGLNKVSAAKSYG